MKLVTITGVLCEIGRNLEGRKGWDVFISEHDRSMYPEWIIRGAYSRKIALEVAAQCIDALLQGYSLIHRGTKIHVVPGFGQMLTKPGFCQHLRSEIKDQLWKESDSKRQEQMQQFAASKQEIKL